MAVALAASLSSLGAVSAYADDASSGGEWLSDYYPSGYVTPDSTLIKTYGVRAGSAGADFLGVTNTNFDFTSGSASSDDQYTGYTSATDVQLVGLTIWGSSEINDNANPYYTNLLYHAVKGESVDYEATTWMSNPSTSSWGDSNGSTSYVGNDSGNATTIAGLEYSPEIVFGANKYTNWELASDGSNSDSVIYAYEADDDSYNPVYVNNDATNIWTQVYTMGQLAQTADSLSGTTRYDSATASALAYEKAIKGQLLYIASKIDSGTAKKTVAYLYAIDATGTGYFFVPTADGLLAGDDTGAASENDADNADDNYAANNSTINMGYMATLPLITTTFDSGMEYEGGIVMKVEDIYKENPVCTVGSGSASDVMADVDVIIYNSSVATSLIGTSGGKNSSGVEKAYDLTDETVAAWADDYGFEGRLIAGDDFGTSTNQGYGTVDATEDGMAPLLYCQRNYTADKNARAAWAFAQVYPDLYGGNEDATYAYWVDAVYHVKTEKVSEVAALMTGQSSAVVYDTSVAAEIEANATTGYEWWAAKGSTDSYWGAYAFYSGSSRASYYGGETDAEESSNTIGILAPSTLWTAEEGDK